MALRFFHCTSVHEADVPDVSCKLYEWDMKIWGDNSLAKSMFRYTCCFLHGCGRKAHWKRQYKMEAMKKDCWKLLSRMVNNMW